ncbi:polysaccharide deacetylase family protein [bacterium]|nr:polysaccharide deacetylase family protein [bacterium]
MTKPIASLSLDLDNKWSYMKTHGDEGWEKFPSYLDLVVPRFLEFLEKRSQKITVFVVGQDAVRPENRDAIASISAAGHEIANHSFHHEPWLHLYKPEELLNEFQRSEDAIYDVTGQRTVGFRGPGFSLSDRVLMTLNERGYEYDCSTFPTYLGPLARMYYFFTARLTKEEKEQRKQLFGRMSDGFQPNRPFEWNLGADRLLEIPVTTMPIFKVPIHLSYILFLSRFSTWAARAYFWKAMKLCRIFGIGPSLLLHPLDFLGAEDDKDLAFFPAMDIESSQKIKLLGQVLDTMDKNFEIVCMRDHAHAIKREKIRNRSIQLARSGAS